MPATGAIGLLGAALMLAVCSTAQGGEAREKLVGMYVHQHWPYHHPYAAGASRQYHHLQPEAAARSRAPAEAPGNPEG